MKPFLCLCVVALCAVSAAAEPVAVWLFDPLEKVFADARPGAEPVPPLEAARGEQATFQVVVRANHPLANVRVAADPLTAPSGAALTAR
ncbi:MAG TPA: hypothetical protein PKV69_02150, partial [Candidatus Hydrogenedentes bacterium]|nr:hypothetical protein [Candidatus Hydrogenedentota bacterium]